MRTALRLLLAGGLLAVLAACGDAEDAAEDVELDDTEAEEPDDEDENDDADDPEEPEDDEETRDEDEGVAEAEEADDDAEGAEEVTTFALRTIDGDYFVESVTVELDEPTLAVAGAAVEALLSGDLPDPGLTHAVDGSPELLGASIDDGVLIVDLDDSVHDGSPGGASHEEAFAQALAHTAAQFDDVDAVRLHVEGEPVDELWGHLDWSGPIEPDPFMRADVDVETPVYGDEYSVGDVVEVSGTSLTFEATVVLRLYGPDGDLVDDSFTTADQPEIDQRGDFSHQFDTPVDEPGEWTVEVESPDPSDGEADRAQYRAEFAITVTE